MSSCGCGPWTAQTKRSCPLLIVTQYCTAHHFFTSSLHTPRLLRFRRLFTTTSSTSIPAPSRPLHPLAKSVPLLPLQGYPRHRSHHPTSSFCIYLFPLSSLPLASPCPQETYFEAILGPAARKHSRPLACYWLVELNSSSSIRTLEHLSPAFSISRPGKQCDLYIETASSPLSASPILTTTCDRPGVRYVILPYRL